MSNEIVRRYRRVIPERHRGSLDTRLRWLWHQRFGTIQMIWKETDDVLDKTACTIYLQAIMGRDLNNVELLLQRLEGGAREDTVLLEEDLRI